MRNLKIALAAALLLGSVGTAANAAVGVGFDVGGVSVGFSDGYWDNGHHWHAWRNHSDMQAFRAAHADAYHGWRHDDKNHHM